MINKILIIFITLLISANAQENKKQNSQELPDTSKTNSYEFKIKEPSKVIEEFGLGKIEKINLNDNGTPSWIWGDLNKGITETDPIEKCYQFFELHKELFGMINPREELVVYRTQGGDRVSTVKFYQAHGGVRVRFGQYFVHFNKDEKITGINGSFDPEARSIDAIPSISVEQAREIAINSMEKPTTNLYTPERVKPELYIARFGGNDDVFNGKFRLVWKWPFVGVPPDNSSWYYYIDAKTGEFVKRESAVRSTPLK
ncbi:MAG: PepSY domain-containing protein [candidate division Zixibacteria bacterium]|nr:PepSY domain-containing protein [candidate division Zixibacteria bacterium]